MRKIQDPLWHFLQHGSTGEFSPSVSFDASYYLEKNDDVRLSKINPLYHYLVYGRAERRLPLRSAPEAIHYLLPETSPLRLFITPSLGQRRVSLLLDSSTPIQPGSTLKDVLDFCAAHAEAESASLRILFRPDSLDIKNVSPAIEGWSKGIQDSLEITEVPTTLSYSDIPFFEDEVSIATSWSSALALRSASAPGRTWIFQIPQSPEPSPQKSSMIPNNFEAREHLFQSAIVVPAGLTDRWNQEIIAPIVASEHRRIAVLVDADEFPLAWARVIEALATLVVGYDARFPAPTITMIGPSGPRMAFAEEIEPAHVPAVGISSGPLTANCVLLLSAAGDTLPSQLRDQGVTVVHSRPGMSGHAPMVGKPPHSGVECGLAVADIVSGLRSALRIPGQEQRRD